MPALTGWVVDDDLFGRILTAIAKDKGVGKQFNNTVDQPYFNEQVVRTLLRDENLVSVMPSSAFGFNAPLGGNPRHVLLNYAGNVGDGEFHFQKVEKYYQMLFA